MKHAFELCLVLVLTISQFGFAQKSVVASGASIFGSVEISKVDGLNSDGLDFSPTPFENGMLVTSTRKSTNGKRKTSKSAFTDLYFAKQASEFKFNPPVPLRGKINSKAHDGIACYNNSMQCLFFTRNKKKKSSSQKGKLALKIYSAQLKNGAWNEIKEVSINQKNSSSCHPTFSTDGMTMFFASDRSGGHGGMDIYSSTFENGKWEKPVNLGPKINTKGNELFPSMGRDQTLYFSSNGRKGEGGLDLYRVNLGTSKQKVESLGKTFNTRKDDFGFMINADEQSGYFSSNRIGGKGGDDIYYWSYKSEEIEEEFEEPIVNTIANEPVIEQPVVSEQKKPIVSAAPSNLTIPTTGFTKKLLILDKTTSKPIPNAVIKLSDSEKHGLVQTYRTDKQGYAEVIGDKNSNYFLVMQRAGYSNIEIKLNAKTLQSKNAFVMNPLESSSKFIKRDQIQSSTPKESITISGKVNISDAQILLLDECVEVQTSVQVDDNGNFEVEMDCDCNYKLTALKYGYTSNFIKMPLYNSDCNNFKDIKVELLINKVAAEEPQSIVVENQPEANEIQYNGRPVTQTSNVRLDKIYYNFNAFSLTKVARNELDDFADFLKQHPGMIIELSSHTDAKGTFAYNLELSEKRALVAVAYLVSRGVQRDQIKPRGYGESKPINHCYEGVVCNEEEHKENRRTEFRVISYDSWTSNIVSLGATPNELTNKKIIEIANIHYSSNAFELDEISKRSLNQLAKQMIKYPAIKIAINSHTDQKGDENYNLILSQKRARIVGDYLGKRGIPTTRFEINGLGESKTLHKGRITEIVVTEVKDSNFVVVYKE